MRNSQVPVARKDGLVVQETADEVLVYDLNTNKAHCLNQTAAFVWKSCDGQHSIDAITRRFEAEMGVKVDTDLIWLALDQLHGKQLLENDITSNLAGTSRRELIKKVGLAAVVAMPVVASLTAPTSVLASSSCACPAGVGDCLGQAGCPSNACPAGICQ